MSPQLPGARQHITPQDIALHIILTSRSCVWKQSAMKMMKNARGKALASLVTIRRRQTRFAHITHAEAIGCVWLPKRRVWCLSSAKVHRQELLAATPVMVPM